MPLGHSRFNERRARPNPSINFITPVRQTKYRTDAKYSNSDQAFAILEAIAAQFRPIMKKRGYAVNSFEEYEWNREFLGRNWNAGEIVELVLRKPDGAFMPYNFLLSVMCHELAHISQMNHSGAFWKVNSEIKKELAELRDRGYTGDGMWSAGNKLTEDGIAFQDALDLGDMPEYTCGGANKRPRFSGRKRKPRATTSTSTSRKRNPKAGSRVKRQGAFKGDGQVLDSAPESSTYRKRAQSRSAREARVVAIERRLEAEAEGSKKGGVKDEEGVRTEGDVNYETGTETEEEGEAGWEKEEEEEDRKSIVRNLPEDEKQGLRDEIRRMMGSVTDGGNYSGGCVGKSDKGGADPRTVGKGNGKGKEKEKEVIVIDDSDDETVSK